MEYLLIDPDGEAVVIKGRELNDGELAAVEEGDWLAFRYRGNTFEKAAVESVSEEDDDGEQIDGSESYEVEWEKVEEAE